MELDQAIRFNVRLGSFCAKSLHADPTVTVSPYLVWTFADLPARRTAPKPKQTTARWTECWELTCTLLESELRTTHLRIEVWDANVMVADLLLGRVVVDLYTIATGPPRHILPLTRSASTDGPGAAWPMSLEFDIWMEQLQHPYFALKDVAVSLKPGAVVEDLCVAGGEQCVRGMEGHVSLEGLGVLPAPETRGWIGPLPAAAAGVVQGARSIGDTRGGSAVLGPALSAGSDQNGGSLELPVPPVTAATVLDGTPATGGKALAGRGSTTNSAFVVTTGHRSGALGRRARQEATGGGGGGGGALSAVIPTSGSIEDLPVPLPPATPGSYGTVAAASAAASVPLAFPGEIGECLADYTSPTSLAAVAPLAATAADGGQVAFKPRLGASGTDDPAALYLDGLTTHLGSLFSAGRQQQQLAVASTAATASGAADAPNSTGGNDSAAAAAAGDPSEDDDAPPPLEMQDSSPRRAPTPAGAPPPVLVLPPDMELCFGFELPFTEQSTTPLQLVADALGEPAVAAAQARDEAAAPVLPHHLSFELQPP